jgi:hypothetical protein
MNCVYPDNHPPTSDDELDAILVNVANENNEPHNCTPRELFACKIFLLVVVIVFGIGIVLIIAGAALPSLEIKALCIVTNQTIKYERCSGEPGCKEYTIFTTTTQGSCYDGSDKSCKIKRTYITSQRYNGIIPFKVFDRPEGIPYVCAFNPKSDTYHRGNPVRPDRTYDLYNAGICIAVSSAMLIIVAIVQLCKQYESRTDTPQTNSKV